MTAEDGGGLGIVGGAAMEKAHRDTKLEGGGGGTGGRGGGGFCLFVCLFFVLFLVVVLGCLFIYLFDFVLVVVVVAVVVCFVLFPASGCETYLGYFLMVWNGRFAVLYA